MPLPACPHFRRRVARPPPVAAHPTGLPIITTVPPRPAAPLSRRTVDVHREYRKRERDHHAHGADEGRSHDTRLSNECYDKILSGKIPPTYHDSAGRELIDISQEGDVGLGVRSAGSGEGDVGGLILA